MVSLIGHRELKTKKHQPSLGYAFNVSTLPQNTLTSNISPLFNGDFDIESALSFPLKPSISRKPGLISLISCERCEKELSLLVATELDVVTPRSSLCSVCFCPERL